MPQESYPDDLLYHPEHDWARVDADGEHAVLGITWFAQDSLGEVVFFDPPSVGTAVSKDASYTEVESVKAVSDVIAPLSGEIVEVNEALGDNPDIDLQLAYVELLLDTSRPDAALPRIDKVIAADPRAPLAHFWRAKVLLELHRPADAAAAAEESIRLQSELPEAHNLLIRIYQMQGRTKEAAQQAQWLRDYQRRVVLH